MLPKYIYFQPNLGIEFEIKTLIQERIKSPALHDITGSPDDVTSFAKNRLFYNQDDLKLQLEN